MKREEWKDLMEGIGFVAIVASLIFLGVETRNNVLQAELNTRALQIAAYQDLIDNISEMNNRRKPVTLGTRATEPRRSKNAGVLGSQSTELFG